MNRLYIFFADLIKRSRRRNRELSLPAQERAHLPYGLKPGYIRLQKDSINRATSQSHMITQQKPIVAHDNSLTSQATHRKTVFLGGMRLPRYLLQIIKQL
jgi:hypothetical protein